jgi:hypothetical protein
MGYCGSVQYVQRELNYILRDCRDFARAYIDDIVIFSKTLDNHVDYLDKVFGTLDALDVTISPKKSYVRYPSVTLLGYRVNSFGYTTHEEKVEAILNVKFPETFADLERYIGLTGWQRMYIPYFAQITAPLEARKKELLQDLPYSGNSRRYAAKKTKL